MVFISLLQLNRIFCLFSQVRMADSSDSEGSEHRYAAALVEYDEPSDYEITEPDEEEPADMVIEEPTFDPVLTTQHAVSHNYI